MTKEIRHVEIKALCERIGRFQKGELRLNDTKRLLTYTRELIAALSM